MALATSRAEAPAISETALGWICAAGCNPPAVAGTGLWRYDFVRALRCCGAQPRGARRAGLPTGSAAALERFTGRRRRRPLWYAARLRPPRAVNEFAATVCKFAAR